MYQNESFDEYIRSVLGYPSLNTMQNENYIRPDMLNYYGRNTISNMQNDDSELENCYPEIYKLVYPMILKRCEHITEPMTRETIDHMTNEIYNAIEVTNEINVNINLENEIENNREETKTNFREKTNKVEMADIYQNTNKIDNRQEDRHFSNRNLRDLIKILLIRELLRKKHNGRPHFPSKPNFPNGGMGPGRPPIMPRNSYLDIYE